MNDTGSANGTPDPGYPDGSAGRQGADGARPVRRGLARFARPALIAGLGIAAVCVAFLVIIFFLDAFNATVYSVGGKDVSDATDEARAIRNNYAGVRAGGIAVLAAGMVLAAAGALVLYLHRNDRGAGATDDGEDVDFADLGGE